ncbi:hypothetical protein PC129_g13576 [Phytophthora cactorum]|uniref:Uncharacterized protein n=1 Tax=Phytophthora cactorum TaxID=29920 RepID=A0A8T1HUL1_9STRA|nr:hypothetical protein Pcac1_g11866 [Phytophthora cactorum]KAG2894314.1 hypothetical protein PC114_g15953 [Phytophthora cactorum]KAG3074218.1 hypothetical protein PC122_g14484 [Phytophthora cactorum]KAG3215546.1 hypothetical protein PC129_g13576 [Phytophthora cactorum]
MPAAPKNPKPFRKRLRLTKQQDLEICELQTKILDASNVTLTELACTKLSLARAPSPQVTGRVLKSSMTLRALSADCLALKKARPKFQLQLDQSVVEFVIMCEEVQLSLSLSLSGEMIMVRAGTLAIRLSTPDSSLPKFSWS